MLRVHAPGVTGWNYADIWETIAFSQPDNLALLHGDREVSWGDFDRRATGLAGYLRDAGCIAGDKVGFYLTNVPEYLEMFYACSKASLVHVNTNFRYGKNELVYLWDNADAVAIVFHGTYTETIEELRSDVPDVTTWLWVDDGNGECPDWAVRYEDAVDHVASQPLPTAADRSGDDLILLYTGGTTGMPKGVMWRQEDLILATDAANRLQLPPKPDLDADGRSPAVAARIAARPGPRSIPACPLMHGTGLFNSLTTLSLGGSVATLTGVRLSIPELLDTIEHRNVKSIFIVGDAFAKPILDALNAEPDRWDLSCLRVMLSSGVMWGNESKQGLLAHYPKLILVDTYGSSEAMGVGSSVSSASDTAKTASFTLSDKAVVIDDNGNFVEPGSGVRGRIGVRGHNPIGYYKDDAKTAQTFPMVNGVRYSIPGDYATVEADGSITLLGRGSVCINTAGEKVFPEEVEEALKRVPNISDAIAVGIPDERFGQSVTAVVEAPADTDIDAAIAHVKSELAGYKAPKRIFVVDSLERAANGKVNYKRWTDYATKLAGV